MSFASFVWTFSERKAKLECVMQFFFFYFSLQVYVDLKNAEWKGLEHQLLFL